ncbi:MAG: hypothetical protein [Podoviridae sp. ctviO18]|nr:MAG: hypothetical protein [Podoviridae sp. ctviO18]
MLEPIKLFRKGDTNNPDIKRVIDLAGNWTHYFVVSKNLYVPAVNWILKIGFPKGIGFYEYLLSVTKEEARKVLEEAGERGSRIHSAIIDLLNKTEITKNSLYPNELTGRPELLTQDEWACLLSWQAFTLKYKPRTIAIEKTVATDKYAGTIDWIGYITLSAGDKINENGKSILNKETREIKILLDWKSSGAIYTEYKAQTGSYYDANGDESIGYTGVLRMGTGHLNGLVQEKGYGYELKIWDKNTTDQHIRAFKASQLLCELENPEPYEFNTTEIPASIQVDVPIVEDESKLQLDDKVKTPASPKVSKAKKAMPKKAKGEKTNVKVGLPNS